ncbi:hypothetical protein ABEB36_009926 [Hypothenemus hampei]|uniref:Uncharacterized protein n=1 Tax=Hypothenemus hampei TaxID=57062 RepID=A0ABD1EHY0_HYPHA
MLDKSDDEMFLVSSDTESDWGDENHLFYDEKSKARMEIKRSLRAFDSDTGGLSNAYQNIFVPILNESMENFTKWLFKIELLSSYVSCPNSLFKPDCMKNMEIVLAMGMNDSYQLRCRNCLQKESIRKFSVFEGLNCNLRSAIRILYGWVKGIDLDTMADMLGLDTHLIGKVYNRAAKLALACMRLCPGIGDVGGPNIVVLIDIYPNLLREQNCLRKACKPIICVCEIESLPQKYWLEPLEEWDKTNPNEVSRISKKIFNFICTVVQPGSILILPNESTILFSEYYPLLCEKYQSVKTMDDLQLISTEEASLADILTTIWKKPLEVCEEANFFNPYHVSQFLTKHLWSEFTEQDSFTMLINFIVHETRNKNMLKYLKDSEIC